MISKKGLLQAAEIIGVAIALVSLVYTSRNYEQAAAQLDLAKESFLEAKRQTEFTQRGLQATQLTQFSELAGHCEPGKVEAVLGPEDAWFALCHARTIARDTVLNDLMIELASSTPSLVNAGAAREISIHLEDMLVRELLEQVKLLIAPSALRVLKAEDRCRIRKMFLAVYFLPHPRPTLLTTASLEEMMEQEVYTHRTDLQRGDDAEHAKRFLLFNEMLNNLSAKCNLLIPL